jgi:hypothetical protein
MGTMEYSEETRKGDPVEAAGVEIIPVVRRSRRVVECDTVGFAFWVLEPIGVEVRTAREDYALDIEGRRSDSLDAL